ncbi:zinc finger (c3hc4 ring finger) domain-containing protein [Cyclospora cayetanensis]|uniref:RING-type E3 ubiquitin transferase n=1 Tax=Cyclospora cayetanensis TaxID=88456 RepID=A0A1D3D765_9EIME|nr:zinc finger (c3hc4 ring finger) domain-containing protein [Cyclospora cayetanensis]
MNTPSASHSRSTESSGTCDAVSSNERITPENVVLPYLFRRHQSMGSPFVPGRITFPPPTTKALPAVWSWQMGEAEWVPFDAQLMEMLEDLWRAMHRELGVTQQDEEPELLTQAHVRTEEPEQQSHNAVQAPSRSRYLVTNPRPHAVQPHPSVAHKVFVFLAPWHYCIDVETMTQQNTTTRTVRPIRRAVETAGLWYAKGSNGYAKRFHPQVEAHLEALLQGSLLGVQDRHAFVVAWQDNETGALHFTDVARMEVSPPSGASPPVAEDPAGTATAMGAFPLPSLSVGTPEEGEAYCAGYNEPLQAEDFQQALTMVEGEGVPEDCCAICLDSFALRRGMPPHNTVAESRDQQQRENGCSQIEGNDNSGQTLQVAACDLPQGCCDTEGPPATSMSSSTDARYHWRASSNITDISRKNSESRKRNQNEADGADSEVVVRLKKCSHHFHSECIRMYMRSCSRGGFYCPTCNVLQLPGNGPSPPGTIIINYYIAGGIQTERHAQPKASFTGARRRAYLPDCLRGRQLLQLLIEAFVKGHIFTVGHSVTSGNSNVVIWNGIHHKTSASGGQSISCPLSLPSRRGACLALPPACPVAEAERHPLRILHYGYPDETFLSRLEEELRARGFPLEGTEPTKRPIPVTRRQDSPSHADDPARENAAAVGKAPLSDRRCSVLAVPPCSGTEVAQQA